MAAKKSAESLPLEKQIERLEAIVQKLENPEAGLEECIVLYSEGTRIGAEALRRLSDLERKIEQVTASSESGALETEPFGEENEE